MLKLVERGFFSSAIKLADPKAGMPGAVSPDVQILRVGKFKHPKYGDLDITPLVLAEMKKNFDNKIRGVDIALDYFHDSDKSASGWLKEMYLSEDGNELWGKVEWTPKAIKMLSEREVRYFSPDFAFEWSDPESGKTFENVLFGGGLTNRPFVKEMAAIVASENQGGQMTLVEMEAKLKKLAEDGEGLAQKHADLQKAHSDLLAKHGELQKKLEEMGPPAADDGDEPDADDEPKDLESAKKQLSDMKAKCAEYEENAKKAEEAKKMAEKKSEFAVLLSEGKACAAQEKAFIEGDMSSFMKLAQPVNLKGSGHGGSTTAGADERDDKVLKLAEEKCKADPKLKLHDAIKIANKEIQK